MMLYKNLPGGGVTSRPASPGEVPRLLQQGWSETCPVINPPALIVDPVHAEVTEAVTAVRRGRKAKSDLN